MELYLRPGLFVWFVYYCLFVFETRSVCTPGWTQAHLWFSLSRARISCTVTPSLRGKEGGRRRKEGRGEVGRERRKGRRREGGREGVGVGLENNKEKNRPVQAHIFARPSSFYFPWISMFPFLHPLDFMKAVGTKHRTSHFFFSFENSAFRNNCKPLLTKHWALGLAQAHTMIQSVDTEGREMTSVWTKETRAVSPCRFQSIILWGQVG